jgi:hypothetical protein
MRYPFFSLTPNPGGLMRYLTIIFCAVLVLFCVQYTQARIIHVPPDSFTIQASINGAPSRDYMVSSETTEPCDVECPVDGIPEEEPICEDDWEDIWNSGCGGHPVAFDSISCNTKICGTSGTFLHYGAQYRDTDWFRVELTEAAILTWSAVAEFPVLILVMDAGYEDCIDYEILDWKQTDPCDTATISLHVPAGVYWLWIAPWVFEGYPCGGEYVAEIKCGVCGDCAGDGMVDIADVIYLINYLFINGPPPNPRDVGDANSDGYINVGDIIYLLNYLFVSGPPPCEP